LNKVINWITTPTDQLRKYKYPEQNNEECKGTVKDILNTKQNSNTNIICDDSVSLDSLPESPSGLQTVSADIHHDPEHIDISIEVNTQAKGHENVEYDDVVVTRFSPAQAKVTKIAKLSRDDLEEKSCQVKDLLVELDENSNKSLIKEQGVKDDVCVHSTLMSSGKEEQLIIEETNNNIEEGMKPTSIMKNMYQNKENDKIENASDKNPKTHKRNVNFTSQGINIS
jgi:hypothetical protein